MIFFKLHIIFFFLYSFSGFSQQTIVFGKVKDAASGDPVPFANVIFKGTNTGITTKFDGTYRIETLENVDSITVSYIGYKNKSKAVKGGSQNINFYLVEDIVALKEITFIAEENPAFVIMENVIKNKKINDKRSLDAYEYESYTKIEVDIDNLTDKFRDRKKVRKIFPILDSIDIITGKDGSSILPIFFSEAVSKYYVRKDPYMRHEYILKTKVTGLGITDGTFTSQIIGSTYQEYNFYRNYLTILEKEFVSPLNNYWKGTYNYYLVDSLKLGNSFSYRLDFIPKRKNDLAFKGSMWITKNEYALKQIDVTVGKKANLNFIEKLTIKQELKKTSAGPWLPSKTRALLDIMQPTEGKAGILAKFYISNKNSIINKPKDKSFYKLPIEFDEEVRRSDELYWKNNRHEQLSESETSIFRMVDTLRKIPSVKNYIDIARFFFTGFYQTNKIKIGPYPLFLSLNNVEGLRLGFGGETNFSFSDQWIIKGLIGYGLKDKVWKYKAGIDYILSRKPWSKIGVSIRKDVDPVYFTYKEISDKGAFYAINRLGTLSRPFAHTKLQFRTSNKIARNLNAKITLKHDFLNPLFDFDYYDIIDKQKNTKKKEITSTEASLQIEWARDRKYLINDNNRVSGGIGRFPIISIKLTAGMPILTTDLVYKKIGIEIIKKIKLGEIGTSLLKINGEHIEGILPYPLLESHLGNETPFYTSNTYNLMNNFEFISDQYLAMNYRHRFEGKILNHLPLISALKLRLVGEVKILYGKMKQENIDIIVPKFHKNGTEIVQFRTLKEGVPYIEVGYGVENIFKIIRVDFFHRLSYTDLPNTRNFGVKIGFQFIL